MIKQIVNIRENLKKRFVQLKPKEELDQVLDKTGRIVRINELDELNRSPVKTKVQR